MFGVSWPGGCRHWGPFVSGGSLCDRRLCSQISSGSEGTCKDPPPQDWGTLTPRVPPQPWGSPRHSEGLPTILRGHPSPWGTPHHPEGPPTTPREAPRPQSKARREHKMAALPQGLSASVLGLRWEGGAEAGSPFGVSSKKT